VDINKIIARAKAILLTPKTEWPVIAAEPDSIAGLFTGYILIVAAIPAIIHFLSLSVIGVSVPILGSYRVDLAAGLTGALVAYVLSLVGVFIVALIVEALAPTFGGEKNRVQALKTVAYAFTATWVASIIGIVPGLGLIAALAGLIYGLYLLNLGLPFTMKCPPDKSLGYTIVTVIAAIIVQILLGIVISRMGGFGMMGMNRGFGTYVPHTHGSAGAFAEGSAAAGMQDWAKRMQDAGKQVDAAQKSGDANAKADAVSQMVGAALGSNGKVQSLSPDRIKPFLPDTLDGLKRTQQSAERNAALGVQISKATATYSDGASHNLNLEITDTGSLKGLMGFAAGWGGVEQESENDSGYEKTYKSGGELVHEKWNKQAQSGEYGVVIGDRFSVVVAGNAANIDELKQAAASINVSGLEALKNEGVSAN
jgi:Yip1 domain